MFPVYLLEDNLEQRIIYSQIIKNFILINDLPMKLICETNFIEHLLEKISDNYQGLFFLNMGVNGQNEAGLKVATIIRNKVPNAHIVFITNHSELSFMALEQRIAPLDYILKNNGMEYIRSRIKADIVLVNGLLKCNQYRKENIFSYHIGSHYFAMPIAEVVYLSTFKLRPGKIQLHTLHEDLEFVDNLNNLERQYPMLFRSDKSYLVNLNLLKHFDGHDRKIHFINGAEAHVSFRKVHEIVKLLR